MGRLRYFIVLAEREGFEPSKGFTPCHVSSVVVSTGLTHLSSVFNCIEYILAPSSLGW